MGQLKKQRKNVLSRCSTLHYAKLIYRSGLFLAVAAVYLAGKISGMDTAISDGHNLQWLRALIWIVFTVEMVLRLFPSSVESMGCQKQFARNYRPNPGKELPDLTQPKKRVAAVAAAWIVLNGIIGALYFLKVIDRDLLIIICLGYAVCDMICILFFCPFQTWFMKNKCCTTCKIYNWDYAMMFTPLVFIPGIYTWSLLALAITILIVWQVRLHRYPERFCEQTNQSLACQNCQEKLCHHKKQLQHFLKKHRRAITEEGL